MVHANNSANSFKNDATFSIKKSLEGPRNILLTAIGTRGDVQPLAVIGKRLEQDGHRVRIACHPNHKESIQRQGLEFFPVEGFHPNTVMDNPCNTQAIWTRIATFRVYQLWYTEAAQGVLAAATQPDPETKEPFTAEVLLSSPWSFHSFPVAEALGIPFMIYCVFPMHQTSEFRHPYGIMSATYSDRSWKWVNRLSYVLFEQVVINFLGPTFERVRQTWGLPCTGRFMPVDSILSDMKVPAIGIWSPTLLKLPTNYHENVVNVGPLGLTGGLPALSPDLEGFLSAGKPPVYFGFGSMRYRPHLIAAWDAVLQVSARLIDQGHRVIYQVSEVDRDLVSGRSSSVFLITGAVPHSTLFSKCSIVVHHGGPGTYQAALVHGKPNVIVSFVCDHPFWGELLSYHNVGRHVPVEQVTSYNLWTAVSDCFSTDVIRAARSIGMKMAKETGSVDAFAMEFYKRLPPKGEKN